MSGLTKAQRRTLEGLTVDWADMPDEWKAGKTFLDLEERGLADWRDDIRGGGDVRTGPGSHGHHVWQTRITPAGRSALSRGDEGTSSSRTKSTDAPRFAAAGDSPCKSDDAP